MPQRVPDLDAAEQFVWRNARLLERHRFAHMFRDGSPEPVLAALRAYANPDGGFGNALEPDFRGPPSQPATVAVALEMIDEAGAGADPMVGRALEFLSSVTTPDGGVPFVLPNVVDYPRAPWWAPEGDSPPGAILPTGLLAGRLHKLGVQHPWLDGASEFCWRTIDQLGDSGAYAMRAAFAFLDHVPDHARAEAAAERVGTMTLERGLVELDPDAEGEVHTPLDFAPRPDCLARRLFDDETIERHLDALVAAQDADGGWRFNWPVWTPVIEHEWRGWMTVHRLTTLRDYGRLEVAVR
jgi:hypothetical protein